MPSQTHQFADGIAGVTHVVLPGDWVTLDLAKDRLHLKAPAKIKVPVLLPKPYLFLCKRALVAMVRPAER